MMQSLDSSRRVPARAHADFVQAITLGVITDGQRKRQSVFHHHRVTADISLAANTTELMHARIRPYVRVVFDDYVARQRRGVGHYDMIANQAIVRDVCLGHEETIVAGLSNAAAAFCASMNRHELANAIAPSNFCGS